MHLDQSVVELEVLLTRITRRELDAGWDRPGSWDLRRQQLLVDSVVRSWPIPPIVIASRDETETLLDGRERLRALWRFTLDQLPFPGGTTPVEEYLDELDGLCYSQLPERFRRRVQRYGVPVLRVSGHSDDEMRELMSRWDPAAPRLPEARSPDESVPARPGGAHHRRSGSEPIFDELSAWFLDAAGSPPDDDGGAHARTWSSPADAGYDAARTALHHPTVEVTPAGLPVREPAAHLAPGAIQAPSRTGPPRARGARDARSVGEYLTRLREGATAARGNLTPPG